MRTKVAGVTFSNPDGSSRQRIISRMSESDKIYLEREPTNQYDSNAVKVLVMQDEQKKQIGYLSRDVAADVSRKLKRGTTYDISIEGVGIWNDRPYCELEITENESAPVTNEVPKVNPTPFGPTFTPKKTATTQPAPGPTFTPKKTATTQPTPGPTFTPNKQASPQPKPGPTFTPAKQPTPQPKTNTTTTSPSRPSNTTNTRTTPNYSYSPSRGYQNTPPQPKKSGCFGILVVAAVILSAICLI